MDDLTKAKWYENLTGLWKMWSVQFDLVWTSAIAYYLTLPAACDGASCVSQTGLLAHLPFPAWVLPYLVGLLPKILLRAAPQVKNPPTDQPPKE